MLWGNPCCLRSVKMDIAREGSFRKRWSFCAWRSGSQDEEFGVSEKLSWASAVEANLKEWWGVLGNNWNSGSRMIQLTTIRAFLVLLRGSSPGRKGKRLTPPVPTRWVAPAAWGGGGRKRQDSDGDIFQFSVVRQNLASSVLDFLTSIFMGKICFWIF